jgi:hypothetical protein
MTLLAMVRSKEVPTQGPAPDPSVQAQGFRFRDDGSFDANLHAELHDDHQLLRQGRTWPALRGALIGVGVTGDGEAAKAGTVGDDEREGAIPSFHGSGAGMVRPIRSSTIKDRGAR